ncbi:hypothetical protein NUSPORA_00947 [Nucleospora cyclopteri]
MYEDLSVHAIKIKKIGEEIKEKVTKSISKIKTKICNIKTQTMKSEKAILDEDARLVKELNSAKELVKSVIKKKQTLESKSKIDETELEEIEKENIYYKKSEKELEFTLCTLKAQIAEVDEEIENLEIKKENLKLKNQGNYAKIKEQNELYKKQLGLEIKPIKNNVVKIFMICMHHKCFVTFDFEKEEPLIESEPVINLDKLNVLYKEQKNIYKFLKTVRNEFKNKM